MQIANEKHSSGRKNPSYFVRQIESVTLCQISCIQLRFKMFPDVFLIDVLQTFDVYKEHSFVICTNL